MHTKVQWAKLLSNIILFQFGVVIVREPGYTGSNVWMSLRPIL